MQSPDFSQNYFELFGLNPNFELDSENLHTQQRRLQATYHPDRYVNGSEREKRLSIQIASWVNQAYETLRDPVRRAKYLLELSGITMEDDSETTSDTEFLMEQIDLREEIESCRGSEDSLDCCDRVATKLTQRATDLSQEFISCFNAGDLESARLSSRKMQFIQRIQHQLSDLQFELEDF
jgi:molecular chaperone HscB